tara:strand:+ start:185 stop:349 length:165 start_codon:yes stop_codon:yes gene_type:complete
MKDILFNKKELDYILRGLYSMQQSYGGGYPHISNERLAKFKDVRTIIKKIQEVI